MGRKVKQDNKTETTSVEKESFDDPGPVSPQLRPLLLLHGNVLDLYLSVLGGRQIGIIRRIERYEMCCRGKAVEKHSLHQADQGYTVVGSTERVK